MRQLLKHGMLAAILSLALPLSAQAWGPEGHEIVSEIALFHLTPAARAARRSPPICPRARTAPMLAGTAWIAILPTISSADIPGSIRPKIRSIVAEAVAPIANATKASIASSRMVPVRSKPTRY